MELFFRSLKSEWIPEMDYYSFAEAQRAISDYISGYYNRFGAHQFNEGMAPNKAEEFFWNFSKSVAKIT